MRLAIDLLIDKEALLQDALWGEGKTTASPSYPASPSYDSGLKNRPQDNRQGEGPLAEAGWPGKLDLVFKAMTNYPYHLELAQIMLEWFREAAGSTRISRSP
ncbi:MAG: hypothetical protein JO283_00120 [Bradyrhizobium sp.]|nr:hypothetical protein [Bradyrhizobium sp.]